MNKREIIGIMRSEAATRDRLARYYKSIGNNDYEKVNKAFADAFRQCAVIVELKLTETPEELKIYKKALELACDEIMWRDCKNAYNYSFYCKTDCGAYEACNKKIKWEDYFLKKAKED